MKTIEIFENIRKNGSFEGTNVSKEVYWAYNKSLENETEILDLDDTYSEDEIAEIVKTMKDFGITEFTVSSGWSSTIKSNCKFYTNFDTTFSDCIFTTLWLLEQYGCKIKGTTRVNSFFKDCETGVRETKPAVLFSL